MYKMDHELGNINTTMQTLQREKAKIENLTEAERGTYVLDLENTFNSLILKNIQRTYAEMGKEMINLLIKRPDKAIPIIYDRLLNNYNRQ